jgi:oligopeptide/dipeptide ABC transporter ATP-binding protein
VSERLLEVSDLSVAFRIEGGENLAVDRISFGIDAGETMALVGESGSGKSVTALSVLQLLPYGAARHPSGSVRFRGQELVGADYATLAEVRGNRISMIFQEPMTSLNPLHTVEKQINEVLLLHKRMSERQAHERTLELLRLVRIHEPEKRLDSYPHQLSGGQRQRVMIAMALANEPELLIADEPTTALDVTVQAQILEVLEELRSRLGIGLILITHDLGVVAGMADAVAVMYAGRVVERGDVDAVFDDPRHPYTRGLLAALPTLDAGDAPLVGIEGRPPSLRDRPPGCAFHPRCALAEERCRIERPTLRFVGSTWCACHLAEAADHIPEAPAHRVMDAGR